MESIRNLVEIISIENLRQIITAYGYYGHLIIWAIVFAESGLFFGFFLPGDSLLIAAGILASQQILNIQVLIFGCFVCAVLGDNVGYATGHKLSRKLFEKPDTWYFKKKYLIKAQDFYEEHGKKAIVLARFLPIVRTFAPIVAGISSMRYRVFMSYNLIGGFLWTVTLPLLGYFVGKKISAEKVDQYLIPSILVVIILSFIPSIIHLIKDNKK